MDTTAEPDTESAGMLQKLFAKPIVLIFYPVENNAIKKTLCS